MLLAQDNIIWYPPSTKQSKSSIKGLQVGDTVPDVFIPQILRYHKSSASLSDYHGKVLILDFWSTNCSVCLQNMPFFHALQKRFEGELEVLPVTYESKEQIETFFTNYRGRQGTADYSVLREYAFPTVVADTILRNLFPMETLPHIVVLDKSGVVRGITGAEYINDAVIQQLVDDSTNTYIPLKRSGFNIPTLERSAAYKDVRTYGPVFYGAVIGFTDGVGLTSFLEQDTTTSSVRFYVSNVNIRRLYAAAIGKYANMHNRTIFEVDDPMLYTLSERALMDVDWRRKHWFSYEAILPISTSRETIKSKMLSDLNIYFGLHGRIEKRIMNCLVIKVSDTKMPAVHKQGASIKHLMGRMSNRRYGMPPVLNETGYPDSTICFPSWQETKEINGVDGFRKLVSDSGFILQHEERELDMFVLSEPGHAQLREDQLILTAHGYLPTSASRHSNSESAGYSAR